MTDSVHRITWDTFLISVNDDPYAVITAMLCDIMQCKYEILIIQTRCTICVPINESICATKIVFFMDGSCN